MLVENRKNRIPLDDISLAPLNSLVLHRASPTTNIACHSRATSLLQGDGVVLRLFIFIHGKVNAEGFVFGEIQLLKRHFLRIFCIFAFINTTFYMFIKLRSVSEKRNIFVLGEIHRVRKHAKRCTEKL